MIKAYESPAENRLSIYQLIIFAFIALFVMAFLRHQKIEHIAVAAAKQYCAKAGVTYLDGYALLRSIRIKPSKRSLLSVQRVYRFEFSSTGDLRYTGQITTLGKQVLDISLEAFKAQEEQPPNL